MGEVARADEDRRHPGARRQQAHSAQEHRALCGRPMIAWSIDGRSNRGCSTISCVSTDDDEIAAAGEAAGATAPFRRPAELSDDHCGTLEVISHAVHWAVDEGWAIESACCIYATAPLIAVEDLGAGCDRLDGEEWDYVFAAARYSSPPQRAFHRREDGGMQPLYPEHRVTRSQDLPAVYYDAGQFYWGTTKAWLEERPLFGPRSSFIELPASRVQDIDTTEDWAMAERLFHIAGPGPR